MREDVNQRVYGRAQNSLKILSSKTHSECWRDQRNTEGRQDTHKLFERLERRAQLEIEVERSDVLQFW